MDLQIVQTLEATLALVLSSDSAAIKTATSQLSELYTDKSTLSAAIYIIQNNQNEQLRKLASVEARKLINRHWESIGDDAKTGIKDSILTVAFTENNKSTRHQVARIISNIASYELENGSWPTLLPNLVQAATDDSNVTNKETATFILLSLLQAEIPELGDDIESFLQLFHKTIHDQSSQEIRINSVLALGAAAAISENYIDTKPQLATTFRQSIPSMVEVLKEVIQSADSEVAKEVFNSFNDLLLLDAKLLGDNLIDLVQFIIEIAVNTQVDEEIRNFAIQFLSSATTFRRNKISSKKLGKNITLAALKIASEEIDEAEELDKDDDDNENEESEPNTLALRLITIASSELPPTQVVGTIFEQSTALLTSPNKFERRAGLLAIGYACSGAPDFYTNQITKVVGAIVNGLKDADLIVKLAALHSLSSLLSELQEYISEHYESLLPLIIEIIDSAAHANVYKYACASLDTLIEFMSIDAIGQYLEPLMNKLFYMLQNTQSSKLKAIIVSAIGSTAYSGGIGFTPYFSKSIEILEPYIQNVAVVDGLSEDDVELRALTFENISTMARAVGSETFSQFAKPLIEAAYTGIKSDSSRIREASFAFISNMAKVYRKSFAPFLENIMPEIYKTLQQEEFNINVDDDEEDEFNPEDINDKFQVHTGITIEKEIAAIALAELALGTQDLFAPYVEQSVNILAEQATESYGMRETALASLWKVVDAMVSISVEKEKFPIGVPAGSYVDENVLQLIQLARKLTVETLGDEYEITMVASILDILSELTKKYGPIILMDNGNGDQLQTLCAELMQLLKGQHLCQTLDDDEAQDDEDADASETEALLLESTLEVLVNLSKTLGADFIKIFDSFKDVIAQNIKSKSKNKRICTIGALSDISAGLKESNPYTEELLQLFINRLDNDKSVEAKSNAAYGIGILILNSPNNYSALYPNIFNSLSKLLSKVQKQESQIEEDDEETKEAVGRSYANASGCVARLVLKQQNVVPLSQVLPILISHLPLETGFEEYTPIFKLFSVLYQTGNEEIVQYTPKIIEVFAHTFVKEAEKIKLEKESTLGREENIDRFKQFETEEVKNEAIALLKFLETKYPGSVSQNQTLAAVIV